MPDMNALKQRIDAASRRLSDALAGDGSARDQAARGAAESIRGVLVDLLTLAEAPPGIDRRTIRHTIAPELERYWARQRRDPRS